MGMGETTSVLPPPSRSSVAGQKHDKNIEMGGGYELIQTLTTTTTSSCIECLAFSHDGELLASGIRESDEHRFSNEMITLWKWKPEQHRFKRQYIFGGHYGAIVTLAFSPDDALLISGGSDKNVALWSCRNGRFVQLLRYYSSPASTVNRRRGNMVQRATTHDDQVTAAAFSPNGELIASASRDSKVMVWGRMKRRRGKRDVQVEDYWTLLKILSENKGKGIPLTISFATSGKRLLVGGSNGYGLHIWEIDTLTFAISHLSHSSPPASSSSALSTMNNKGGRDGRCYAVRHVGIHGLRIDRKEECEALQHRDRGLSDVRYAVWFQDDNAILVAGEGIIAAWDVADGCKRWEQRLALWSVSIDTDSVNLTTVLLPKAISPHRHYGHLLHGGRGGGRDNDPATRIFTFDNNSRTLHIRCALTGRVLETLHRSGEDERVRAVAASFDTVACGKFMLRSREALDNRIVKILRRDMPKVPMLYLGILHATRWLPTPSSLWS
eukprot:jgi/Bigna1/89926/estExt_fgenesh1_pg.C_580078